MYIISRARLSLIGSIGFYVAFLSGGIRKSLGGSYYFDAIQVVLGLIIMSLAYSIIKYCKNGKAN
jgi:hypothetical protein